MDSRATVTWRGHPALLLSAIAQRTTCTSAMTRVSLIRSTGARLASWATRNLRPAGKCFAWMKTSFSTSRRKTRP
eukprot:5427164-Pleurochrysis_carterae.AAC.1